MKNKLFKSKNIYRVLAILAVVAATSASCKKYNSLGYTPGTGAPSITSVHTLSKTDTTLRYDTIITYNASGNIVKTVKVYSGQANAFDSVTNAGYLGNYYVIKGANLGSATRVSFNGVAAYLNRAWMTDNSIVVQIPSNTPATGPKATDSLVVVTLNGTAYYKFAIVPPPPTPTSYSDYNFWQGSQIALTGVGFAGVTSVGLTGTTATVTVVSKTDTTLVLRFPSTTVNRASLVFNYTSVGSTLTNTATQELVDLDNAYNIFAFGNNQNGWSNNSWTSPSGPVTGPTHSYGQTQSYVTTFPNGSWQMEGWGGSTSNVTYFSTFKYYTFWILGGVQDEVLTISADQLATPWQQPTGSGIFTIKVPAGVWTYFKIPIGSGSGQINFLSAGTLGTLSNNRLSFFIPGPNGVNETFYVDEVAFVK
ncbi:MAG TPA: hypothetical protein VLD19_15045 [Chitinophagaceae bacterium]|nr:hypothetical protein [Chitinophagaceae bacterium]